MVTSIKATMESANDANWFKINLTAGTTYDFTLAGFPAGADLVIVPAGSTAGYDVPFLVEGAPTATGNTIAVNFTADTSGTYYVQVRDLYDNYTGSYTLSAATVTDSYTLASPGALTVGGSVKATMESANDANWFKINLTAGTTYDFTLAGFPAGADLVIVPAGSTAGYDVPFLVEGAPTATGNTIAVNFTADTSGTYYVQVRDLYDNYTGSYTLSAATVTDSYTLVHPASLGDPTTISGGNNQVAVTAGQLVTLSGTAGNWDTVTGSGATITLASAQASIKGGSDTINFTGSGNSASLYGTNGNWDTVNGNGGTITLNGVQASVLGGNDAIYLNGTGNQTSLYNTNGNWDTVYGSGSGVVMNSAQATFYGGGDTIWLNGTSNGVSLYSTNGNWDTVNGANSVVVMNSAQATIYGGGDVLWLNGTGNGVSLYNTGGNWDTVNAANAVVVLNAVQASVLGGGDVLWFNGSGNQVSLYNTAGNWDTVNASNTGVTLNGVQTSVNGGGDTLWLGGSGNQISLYNTGSNADAINGANAVLILNGVAASVTGNGNQVYLHGSNTLALNGTGETLFADKAFALDTITGFVASDHIQFAAADFANFAALMGATRQSGADTVITLDAKDVITLKNVTASALTSSQFSFV